MKKTEKMVVASKKKSWVKPEIKVEELTMRSLLGDNGWLSATNSRLLAWACPSGTYGTPPNCYE